MQHLHMLQARRSRFRVDVTIYAICHATLNFRIKMKKEITPNILTKPRNNYVFKLLLVYISNNPAFSTYRYRNNYKINPCETTSKKTRVSPKHKARVNANMRLVTSSKRARSISVTFYCVKVCTT